MLFNIVGLSFCCLLIAYLGAKYMGIGFILFSLFGGGWLATYVANSLGLRTLWFTLPLLLFVIMVLAITTVLGAGRGAFDQGSQQGQKTPA